MSSRLGLFLVAGAFFLSACLLGGTFSEHGHSHDEPASYKYSREANEDNILTEEEWNEELSQNDHGHSHGGHGHSHGGHGHSHGPPQKEPSKKQRELNRERLHKIWDEDDDEEEAAGRNVWFQAIGATLLISAAPFVILFFIPLDNSDEKRWLLKIFLSFASGGLLGDAMLHLIPHAMMATEMSAGGHGHGHSHSHSHDEGHVHDMSVGLGVLSGIVAFLCVEKIVRIVNGSGGGHGHSHGGSGGGGVAPTVSQKGKHSDQPSGDERLESKSSGSADEKDDGAEGKNLVGEVKKEKDEEKEEEEKKKDKKKKKKDKKTTTDKKDKDDSGDEKKPEGGNAGSNIDVSGFLNLFADCFHNFTDGLAIGASFAAGANVGKITTLTILLHEVPHEIGDYAILIKSGVPPMKAIMLQLLTAVGALTGCVVSLLAHGDSALGAKSSAFILPFTAGGFIYIATVSVIPDLLDGKTTLRQSLLEVVALLTGIGMMVVIAQYE